MFHESNAARPVVVATLNEAATHTFNYAALVVSSCVIATLGLLENSAAVIIGAMIIAPLITPIQALSFGAIAGEGGMLKRALVTLGIGTIVSIALSIALGFAVSLPLLGSEIVARSKPTLLDLGIALAAGAVAALATVRPSISAAIAGTAVAVALMPPVCVIGIAISAGAWHLALGAALLYLTNLLGIALACMLVYALAGHVQAANRHALSTAIILMVLIAFPLTAGFIELLRFGHLERALSSALVRDTATFKHVELVQMRVDWLKSPTVATLTVRSTEPISPSQVSDLERFALLRTGQHFTLVFEVTPLVEVRSSAAMP